LTHPIGWHGTQHEASHGLSFSSLGIASIASNIDVFAGRKVRETYFIQIHFELLRLCK